MWESPTSMLSRAAVGLLALLVAIAGAGLGGSLLGHGGAGATATTLSILAAGTLAPQFPELAAELAATHPGLSAPPTAQRYTGSLSVVNSIASLGSVADVAAVADFRLIPTTLEPEHASFEVVFASSAEVLAYDPQLSAFDGVNASNWGAKLVAAATGPGALPLAVWNASTDPNGYNAIFSLELDGLLHGSGLGSYYGRFYSGAPGSLAVPDASTTRVALEAQAAELLATGSVCAVLTYRAYAVAHHLTFVAFDPVVGLEGTDTAARVAYANATTTIVTADGGSQVVHAAPILFAASVPLSAPNATLGAEFLGLLLSPRGVAVLSAGGAFDPIVPAWTDRPAAVPPEIAGTVVAMPPWAGAYLP